MEKWLSSSCVFGEGRALNPTLLNGPLLSNGWRAAYGK